MRISLPNEGVTHNKSKDYFEKPTMLDNRRSISSMQKLKLCHPKKGSQINLPISIPRQPLANRSVGAINVTMPLHKKDQSTSKDSSTCAKTLARESSENKENLLC
jgi:cell envelope opacity-associated protein A